MVYKFLIYISYSYAIPIGTPLENEISGRNHKVKWFCDHEEGLKKLTTKENVLPLIQDVVDYAPDIVLTATNNVPDFITGLKVQIFHGFNAQKRPSKKNKFSHFRIRGFFDLYCTQGPSTTKFFEVQQQAHPHFKVVETGWPKVDPLFSITNDETQNLVPHILIASTFTQRLSLAYDEEVFDEIKKLVKTKKYHFIMVLHPKIPKSLVEKWKTLVGDNFIYYDTTDLIPLFQKSDIMFADTTSAIQEFVLQKKPVVTYRNHTNQNYLINVSEATKIAEKLNYALTNPMDIIDNIKVFILELHPYFDGKSSKRVIDESILFLHADKSGYKKKPLNLIRKYKIRKQLGYFTLRSFNKPYTLKND